VLLLVSPTWGNAPFRKYLDDRTFLTLQVITDFQDVGLTLPPHQLVINCISDADACQSSLEAATVLFTHPLAPVINRPAEVWATGREANARRFAAVPGVRTGRVSTLPREFFLEATAAEILAQKGFSFPLLLRAPGFHTGLHFTRVENTGELARAAADLPGPSLNVIEFLDARGADGLCRKYRVMVIDGRFYPAHAAVSADWKVHFFTSGAPDSPEQREIDREFLEDMPRVLGPRVMETLDRIREVIKLDYWGVDFSVGEDGRILLFEANATMNVSPPDADEKWDYRRAPVQRIADAVRTMFLGRATAAQNPTAAWPVQVSKEFTLRQIDVRLEQDPGRIELQIERARILVELERLQEAQEIYLKILIKDPAHFVALNNLAAILKMMGHHKEALKLYRGAFALKPEDPTGRANLAHSLRESAELEEAREHYEAVLSQLPGHAAAHNGLSHVLLYMGETDAAWEHHRKGSEKIAPPQFSRRTGQERASVVLLASACAGNSPMMRFLDKNTFATLNLIPDFFDPATPLPPHDLIMNVIGDADHCGPSLDGAQEILQKATRPVLNLPERIRTTGRVDNARLLGGLEGVVTPRIASFAKADLGGPGGVSLLAEQGFRFPILLRTPGFHEGSHFVRVEKPENLASAVAQLPGRSLMAIEYLDARDGDGKIRKYRVMMIDGRLYPLHKAVSREWMIHYFSAEMTDAPAHRAEEAAFLEDMPRALGPRAMGALERIRDTLGLDYAGADFSLGRDGQVLLFEANATMAAPYPEKGEKWDYRRGAVQQIHDAVRQMILGRAGVASK
jgi:glutathione synthase/RimK-type ligase-like ATP-grasp enzyme